MIREENPDPDQSGNAGKRAVPRFVPATFFCFAAAMVVFGALNSFGPLDLLANKLIMLGGVLGVMAGWWAANPGGAERPSGRGIIAMAAMVLLATHWCHNGTTLPWLGVAMLASVQWLVRGTRGFDTLCRVSTGFLLLAALIASNGVAWKIYDCYQSMLAAIAAAVGSVLFNSEVHVRLWSDIALYSLLVAAITCSHLRPPRYLLVLAGVLLLYGVCAAGFSKLALQWGVEDASYCSVFPIAAFALVNGCLIDLEPKRG
jgi:hypothetical protein